MKPCRTFDKLTSLKNIWQETYKSGKLELSCKPKSLESYTIYNQLHNYRKTIRKLKLNPLFAQEWSLIDSCILEKPNYFSDKVVLKRKCIYAKRWKSKLDSAKHPFNVFSTPKTVL